MQQSDGALRRQEAGSGQLHQLERLDRERVQDVRPHAHAGLGLPPLAEPEAVDILSVQGARLHQRQPQDTDEQSLPDVNW